MFVSLGEALSIEGIRHDPVKQFELAIASVPEDLKDQTRTYFDRALEICESPIEKLLLPWILCQEYSFFQYAPLVLLPEEVKYLPHGRIALIPQLSIGKYRVDFALASSRGGPIRFVIIECDGEKYHEDVYREIDRDAALLSRMEVLSVFPVSGKEIWKDPKAAGVTVAQEFSWAWSKNNKSIAWKFPQ